MRERLKINRKSAREGALAASRHGPADWIMHARMVALSWDGERVEAIAKKLYCSAQTVRRRLHCFDDELGPVVPRSFSPAPGWSPTGHRIKALLDYSRGPEKTWVYGALRVRDGKELTRCAASRNSTNYIALLQDIEADNPTGDIFIITDNLSSHNSAQTRAWMAKHPRLHHVFIPKGACWLNLQEGWWRLFRRDALAGQSFANPREIEQATRIATAQLNHRAKPWIWERPPKDHRHYRRAFCYRI